MADKYCGEVTCKAVACVAITRVKAQIMPLPMLAVLRPTGEHRLHSPVVRAFCAPLPASVEAAASRPQQEPQHPDPRSMLSGFSLGVGLGGVS